MSASWRSFRNRILKIITVVAIAFTPASVLAQNTSSGGAITLRSDVQESNSETGVITARGNVKIDYPVKQLQATAAQAQYFTRERRLVLTGNVYVLQQGNSMRAETLTYLVDEGKFIATPKDNRQVESTYIVTEPIPDNSEEQLNN
ncbi:LptA/OstA family protein [Myxosarcina sp. GI1]|uniref:LptA/OstA family protein n=1 Tax=Myxosarcina sp. GI1 TaxID=1541065 RepID=UPI0005642992|nr:LptA/OstA family protein [Myxosarcina sp. GI1]